MKNTWSNLKKCQIFLSNCKKEIIIILLLSFFTAIISSIIPSLSGNIINYILKSKYKVVIFFAVLIGILQLTYVLFNLLISKNHLSFKQKFTLNIRKKVTRAILDLNIDVYNIYGQGSIINKLKEDSRNIVLFMKQVKDTTFALITNIVIVFYIFYLNKIIGSCYIIVILLLLLFRLYGIKKSIYFKKKYLQLNDDNTTLLGEAIKGAKDIKTLKLKDEFYQKINHSFKQIEDYQYKSNVYIEYTSKVADLIEVIFTGLIIVLSILLIKNNLLTTSTFIIIFMYRGKTLILSDKISSVLNNFAQFNLSINRIFSILEYQRETFGSKELVDYSGKITFKNVTFSYKETDVFNDFNLSIDAKTFTVICGKNGAGKSTLFSLITKMVNPTSGEILLDNTALKELKEEEIRKNISLVNQQPYIFNLSIKENLEMIDDDFNHIKEVCKLVGLEEKINIMEKGYDTKIKEDGANLSGGEKQKLAIARALLSNSKVILLDEITNNLDHEAITSSIELINKLKGKYTIIMITHNKEVIEKADRIIILDDGKIIGDGTHKNLIKENSYYCDLYKGMK